MKKKKITTMVAFACLFNFPTPCATAPHFPEVQLVCDEKDNANCFEDKIVRDPSEWREMERMTAKNEDNCHLFLIKGQTFKAIEFNFNDND